MEENKGKYRFVNCKSSNEFTADEALGNFGHDDTWEVKEFDTKEEAIEYGISKGLLLTNNGTEV